MALNIGEARVAKALSAPTRAAILTLLRERGALTAKEVADLAGVHPNVARGHLDLLVEAGLAAHSWRRNPSGGRPAKAYEALPGHVEEGGTLVSDMLATLIEEAGPTPEAAKRIAEKTGERLGRRFRQREDSLSFEEQRQALLRSLAAVSGGVRIADSGADWIEFEDADCPFRGIAGAHPELACSLDKSLKAGIMRALGAEVIVEVISSVAWGDPTCREVVRIRGTV